MKYIFIPKPKGAYVRTSDNVRGDLHSFPDTATVNSPYPILNNNTGIIPYIAPKLRSLTKRELVDRLIEVGLAVEFNNLITSLPVEERLKWDASPTISPEYPYIKQNKEAICAALNITLDQLENIFK